MNPTRWCANLWPSVDALVKALSGKAAGRSSAMVIQALRSLGPAHVGADRLERLCKTLPTDNRRALLSDLALAPTWMRLHLRALEQTDEP